MIGNPDLAFVLLMAGILGICAGLCGRIAIGVAGGVAAVVALVSFGRPHAWVAMVTATPVFLVIVFLLRIAARARRNKSA